MSLRFPQAFGSAALAVLAHLALVLALAPGSSPGERYLTLMQWDGQHYALIAEQGFKVPEIDGSPVPVERVTADDIHHYRANLMFFPGYPVFAGWIRSLLGIPASSALLAVSLLSALGFWVYFQLLLDRMGVDRRTALLCMALAWLHPASFYLLAAYTEAFFLVLLFGFLFWSGRDLRRPANFILAAAHGFGVTATRIVGAGVVAAPVVQAAGLPSGWRGKLGARLLGAPAGLALVSSLGTVAFFLYCERRFGAWDAYMRLNEVGWGNYRDWFAIIKPWNYVPRFFFEHTVESLNRAANPLVAFLFLWAIRNEKARGWREIGSRLSLYFSAFVIFFVAITGKGNANFDSMIRISLPPVFILIAVLASQHPSGLRLAGTRKLLARAALAFAFAAQAWFVYRFTRGYWVA